MQLTEPEWVVMDVVWDRGEATVRDVHDAVGGRTGWAYSTVKTTMTRLVEKGVLRARREGKTGVFEPALTRDAARRDAVRTLLDRAFDGTVGSLVQHLLGRERVTATERAALREIASDKRGWPQAATPTRPTKSRKKR